MDGLFDATQDLKALTELGGGPESIATGLARALDSLGPLAHHDHAVELAIGAASLRVLALR